MNIFSPQPGKLFLIVTASVLVNCMAIQSHAQAVDYTSVLQAKNDSKAITKKTQKVIKMRLKTPGSDNEWLRIEVNGNTVKPIHTIRTKRKFSGLINSALSAVSPVPLPNVRFDKWLDAPTTRVVFQPDSCPVSPPPQPPQNPISQVSQVTTPPQPPQNPVQGNSVTPPPQPSQNPTSQENSVPPPQPAQNLTAQQVQVTPPPQPSQNPIPQGNSVTPPSQASKNSSLPDQMNSLSNCPIAGTVSVLLPEGTDIYKGRFTIEYTQGDLLRSITFRIRDEDD